MILVRGRSILLSQNRNLRFCFASATECRDDPSGDETNATQGCHRSKKLDIQSVNALSREHVDRSGEGNNSYCEKTADPILKLPQLIGGAPKKAYCENTQ